ncbi:MAG: oxidoreductase [Pseudomonadota bacterium]|nr:oxidoreductase [Pseudomonadota bacterium]
MSAASTTVAWSQANLPDLHGKRALVTGAASGLGLETALGLAARGAEVIIADRNVAGAKAALAQITALHPQAQVSIRELDLGDLALIRRFASELLADARPLDILINNAGILPPLQRRTTADGFELKFGINVLGHFALTGLLLPALLAAPAARVVWTSSLVHRHGKLNFDDLNAERRYDHQAAYNQAKLACLVLAMEMQQRFIQAAVAATALAAHPGIARTSIGASRNGQPRLNIVDKLADLAFWIAMRCFGQEQDRGARPILVAAADANARGGEFYGPDGFSEFSGEARRVKLSPPAQDPATRQRLWAACEQMTGVRYRELEN